MSEEKQISTLTDVEYRDAGTDCKIITFYRELEPPFCIYCLISDEVYRLNQTDNIEGDLILRMIFNPDRIDFKLNLEGELIVLGENADNYYINEQGELIYDDGLVTASAIIEGGFNEVLVEAPVLDGGLEDSLIGENEIIDGN